MNSRVSITITAALAIAVMCMSVSLISTKKSQISWAQIAASQSQINLQRTIYDRNEKLINLMPSLKNHVSNYKKLNQSVHAEYVFASAMAYNPLDQQIRPNNQLSYQVNALVKAAHEPTAKISSNLSAEIEVLSNVQRNYENSQKNYQKTATQYNKLISIWPNQWITQKNHYKPAELYDVKNTPNQTNEAVHVTFK